MALVFCNDYRHPVLVHKAAATVDVLSRGRLDLGMGAGFLAAEYAAAGLPYDRPVVRIARLQEALDVVQALFTGEPVTHAGTYYTVEMAGQPAPVQRPYPPLVIGGGGKRIWKTSVVNSPRQTGPALQAAAQRFGVDPAVARRSLGLLVGTAEECCEQLMERRDRYGLNYP